MLKSKLVVIAIAAMLAMCVGLTACGGSSSASGSAASSAAATSSAAASSVEAASSAATDPAAASSTEASSPAASEATATSSTAASSSAASSEAIFWKGTLTDGSTVCYVDNATGSEAALLTANSDFSDVALWVGPIGYSSDGVVTITDEKTQKAISFTITDVTPTSFTIDLKGFGKVELKAVTEADIKAYAEELVATVKSEGEEFLKEIEEAGVALENKIANEAEKVSSEIEKLSNEYAKMDEKTVLFWDGTLANGKDVVYMDDPESGEAFLSITNEDLSDGAVWYGKYTTSKDGKILTITDAETGTTVTYEVVETTPGKSMKMNVKGYGEVNLSSVTKGDFSKLTDELAKIADESATK